MFEGWITWIFRLNPMAHLINAYRDIFYVHAIPEISNLLVLLGIGLIALVICYNIFKKLEKKFAEEI
jgi:ABC-2 type transport system permease protein